MPLSASAGAASNPPNGLSATKLRRAVRRLERDLADFATLGKARGFSSVVGHVGARALAQVGNYSRIPLVLKRRARARPFCLIRSSGSIDNPRDRLASKGSKRPWAIQSHYDHPGWYIVWRYLIDPTESLEPGKPVIIWRVDVAFLEKSDWKYEKSTAGISGGGRTHTFGVKEAAKKLRDKAVYRRQDVVIRDGKPIPRNGHTDRPRANGPV